MFVIFREVRQLLLNFLVVLLSEFERSLLHVVIGVSVVHEGTHGS